MKFSYKEATTDKNIDQKLHMKDVLNLMEKYELEIHWFDERKKYRNEWLALLFCYQKSVAYVLYYILLIFSYKIHFKKLFIYASFLLI